MVCTPMLFEADVSVNLTSRAKAPLRSFFLMPCQFTSSEMCACVQA